MPFDKSNANGNSSFEEGALPLVGKGWSMAGGSIERREKEAEKASTEVDIEKAENFLILSVLV